MTKEAKMILNMAESIASINGTEIERADLQKYHLGKEISGYCLTVWYSDGKEVIIRDDCTIVEQ